MQEGYTVSSVGEGTMLAGKETGVSDWITIDQSRLNQFADATDDRQWLHVDEERAARELPGGKTIAHGYLTLALIPALTGDFVNFQNLERAINFGLNKVRFYTMVPVGSRVRARAKILQARKRAGALHLISEIRIEVEGAKKPACVAETIAMYFFSEDS